MLARGTDVIQALSSRKVQISGMCRCDLGRVGEALWVTCGKVGVGAHSSGRGRGHASLSASRGGGFCGVG